MPQCFLGCYFQQILLFNLLPTSVISCAAYCPAPAAWIWTERWQDLIQKSQCCFPLAQHLHSQSETRKRICSYMLQNIWFRLAAITATVHVCSHILPPNLKAIGRSAETAGLLVRSKQFEKLRNERWCGAKFRISDKKISVSSALCGFILLYAKHTLVLHGCLRVVPTQRRLVEKKALMSSVSK